MKIILLTRGLIALVDDCDYERLNQYSWFAYQKEKGGHFYAGRKMRLPSGKRRTYDMHRDILGLVSGDGKIADHREIENTLDNRRSNLRVADKFQSNQNQRAHKDNTSGHRGVCLDKVHQVWRARVGFQGKVYFGGNFANKSDAVLARKELARKLHGEFSNE